MPSSSKTTLCGKPMLLVQVTVSPDLMVTSAGSNTSAPPAAPSFTLAALADRARPKEAMPTPAAVAYLQQSQNILTTVAGAGWQMLTVMKHWGLLLLQQASQGRQGLERHSPQQLHIPAYDEPTGNFILTHSWPLTYCCFKTEGCSRAVHDLRLTGTLCMGHLRTSISTASLAK